MLSTLKLPSDWHREQYQIQYLLAHTVEALVDFFPGGSGDEVLSVLMDVEAIQSVAPDYVSSLLAKCEHPVFRECLESVVSPLLSSLDPH